MNGVLGHGVKTRAGQGHEFGLKLSTNEKKALIAFLKTLWIGALEFNQ